MHHPQQDVEPAGRQVGWLVGVQWHFQHR